MQITLSLSSKTDEKTGKSEILIRFSGGRNIRLRAKSGIFIKPVYWDEKNGKIKSVSRLAKKEEQRIVAQTMKKLDNLCAHINTKFTETPSEKVDKEWLEKTIEEFLYPKLLPKSDLELFEALDLFIEQEGQYTRSIAKHWSRTTLIKFKTLKSHLLSFDDELTFSDLDRDKLSEFISYEQDELELLDSTVKKHLVYLKWFLRWAVDMGFNHNMAFDKFTTGIPNQQTKVIFLSEEELNKVITHDFSNNPAMDRVRDVYLFCCFTGLRYSDVENLKKSNIYDDKIHITTIKTDDPLIIELNKMSRSILAKYSGLNIKNNKALPVISNQKMNDALKIMAKECELDSNVEIVHFRKGVRISEIIPKYELITTHTARKTFVCTAIRLGINPIVIMKITGHKNYNTMKPYIDAEDKVRREAMDKFNMIIK